MEKLNVIKVGGAVVEDKESLAALLDKFAALPGHKVLVHGGGRSATKMAAELGIESHMVQGRRITDEPMLRIVQMVYAGLVNKNIVAGLQARGVNAIGLTGADMNVLRAHKRPVKTVTFEDGHQEQIDYGWVGDVDHADGAALARLITLPIEGEGQGGGLVMAPLTHDGQGHMLNTNADTIASETARALAQYYDVTLTYAFEKKGVLSNPDDDDSVIPHITPSTYAQLKADGIISGGMIPKLDNAFEALDHGVQRVIITNANDLSGDCGTTIEK